MSNTDRPVNIAIDFVSSAFEGTVDGKLLWEDAAEGSGFYMPEGGGWWTPQYQLRGDGMNLYVGKYNGDPICAVMEGDRLVSWLSEENITGVSSLLAAVQTTTQSRKLDRAFRAFGFKRAS